jgi:hypothetical protein
MTPRSLSKSSGARRDDADRHRQIEIAHLGVVAGVLLRRHRVVLAADRVERDGDVERGAGRRALEEQVLEKVRRPVGHGHLIA